MDIAHTEEKTGKRSLSKNVIALGIVSALNDMASEVAVRTIPLFLANVLGVKTGLIGLIEGIAETTATLLKLVSGVLSDRLGKRKPLSFWASGYRIFPNRCSILRGAGLRFSSFGSSIELEKGFGQVPEMLCWQIPSRRMNADVHSASIGRWTPSAQSSGFHWRR